MTPTGSMLILTHIPYLLLTIAVVAELWWMRGRLKSISKRLEVE